MHIVCEDERLLTTVVLCIEIIVMSSRAFLLEKTVSCLWGDIVEPSKISFSIGYIVLVVEPRNIANDCFCRHRMMLVESALRC